MSFEVYNTNNGIPMGKAQLGGGGAESDGALYQYMGSVATYAALELLDTTNFKPGYVYDVQEDGMDYAWTGTDWNALGAHTDLSNYYTKTETDAFIAPLATKNELSGKQDRLTANNPLTISEYVMTSLVNMEYNSAGTGFYNSNTTSACQYLDYGFPGKVLFKQRSGQTLTTSNLYDIGHVDIPYQIGQLVAVKVLDESNQSASQTRSMIFGKTNSQGDFIPILYMDNTYSSATLTIGITTDDNISSLTALTTGKYTTSQTWNTSLTSSTSYVTSGTTKSTTMGGYVRIYETSNGIQLLIYNGAAFRVYGKSEVCINSKAITNASLVSRLKEITMVRIIPNEYFGTSPEFAISKTGVGLFDSDLTSFDSFKTTKKTFADLGTNLFDLSGEIKQTYLDLNIGAGLNVQNNVLVNTNPTPVDVSNKVTGVGISEMQALTQTEYDEIGKYYAYEYNGTTVYVRKETPATTDTVYSAIGTASALTITSVGTDSLTLSDGNTYTRSAASDEIDGTQYNATTLYVVKNVVGE